MRRRFASLTPLHLGLALLLGGLATPVAAQSHLAWSTVTTLDPVRVPASAVELDGKVYVLGGGAGNISAQA